MKTIAILSCLAVTTCAVMPARISIQGNYGTYGYSTKDGLTVVISATK